MSKLRNRRKFENLKPSLGQVLSGKGRIGICPEGLTLPLTQRTVTQRIRCQEAVGIWIYTAGLNVSS